MNDFFTISERQSAEGGFSCTVLFDKAHRIFEGHFPGQPVVPGVCMMQMIKELMELQLATPLVLKEAFQVKFLQLITPEIAPDVALTWKADEQGWLVNASFRQEKDLFKFSGLFRPAGI